MPALGPRLERLAGRLTSSGDAPPADTRPVLTRSAPPPAPPSPPSILKRLVVGEDDSIPVAGAVVRVLRWAAANMMMYVCVPAAPGDGWDG